MLEQLVHAHLEVLLQSVLYDLKELAPAEGNKVLPQIQSPWKEEWSSRGPSSEHDLAQGP